MKLFDKLRDDTMFQSLIGELKTDIVEMRLHGLKKGFNPS